MTTAKTLAVFFTALLLACAAPAWADPLNDRYPAPEGTEDKEQTEAILKKLEHLQERFRAAGRPLPPVFDLEDDGIAAMLIDPYMAHRHIGRDTQQRYLVGRLVVINQSDKELSTKLDDVSLIADGEKFAVERDPGQMRYASVYLNDATYSVSELSPAETLTIPAGQIASSWVSFLNLDGGSTAPTLALTWMFDGQPMSLDIREQHELLLDWSLERIGPEGILAIGTVSGEMNTVNLGTIIDDAILLANKKVTRLIIQFGPEAEQINSRLANWFFQTARQAGVETGNSGVRQDLLALPPMIQQFHFVKLPSKVSTSYAGPDRDHEKLIDAVLSATASAYQAINVDQLLEEIREGHPLSQCAALTHGAIRLPQAFLQQVVDLANGSRTPDHQYAEPLQNAAIAALREYPEPQSVDTLRKIALSDNEEQSELAIRSLAFARFPAHQQTLDELLAGPEGQRQKIVQALTDYPRQRWSAVLYEYAVDGPRELRIDSIRALNSIGHPKLMPLLIGLLENDQPEELREVALELLIEREDPASRKQVIDHALKALENAPTQQAISVVQRFKVQEAIPSLLKILKSNKPLQSAAVKALSAIGDDRILDDLLAIYPELNSSDQAAVLRTIAQIDRRRFLDFAPTAFQTDERSVVSTLADILKKTPSLDAIEVLIIAARQAEDDSPQLTYSMQALGNTYSPQSREFLVELRDTGSEKKQELARNALQSLYYRSPAHSYAQQAVRSSSEGKKSQAVQQFTLAIEADSSYPQAFHGRGDAYRSQNEMEKALQDYNTLLELDPKWPGGHASRGQTLSALARFEEALPDLDIAIKTQPDNADWYSARGHAYSMLEQFQPAEEDYRKALELQPNHMTALTGVALSLAINGKEKEAVEMLAKGRDKFANDPIFAYNSACTYARAAEVLRRQADTGDQASERIDGLIDKAFQELVRSEELGYRDAKWTQNDPDLAILKDDARFPEVLEQMRGSDAKDAKKPLRPSNDSTEDAGTPPDA